MAETTTILVAVGDGVLADSFRFSLELEGFDVKLCDEHSLGRELPDGDSNGLLILDQGVFARLEGGARPVRDGIPIVLIVGHKSAGIVARAKAAGVTKVVETPLVGGVLFEAIKSVLDEGYSRSPKRPS